MIEEIENLQDGDLLNSIELSYEPMEAKDDSGDFLPNAEEPDLADKILDLLAENSQKLEKLESELAQLKIDGGASVVSSSASQSDLEVLQILPEKMDFYFYSGSSKLSSGTLLQLNEVVELLARAEGVKVVITGYADKSGDPSSNLELSKRRAIAIKRFMKESGMSEDRFIINYFGESKADSYGNQDRRVEIKFFI